MTGEDTLRLMKELESQPLVLVLAAAYIRESSCGVQQYVENRLNKRVSGLWSTSADSVAEPVAVAFAVSFDEVHARHSRSADLLSLMSVLGRGWIPQALLTNKLESQRSFHAVVRKLRGYGLI